MEISRRVQTIVAVTSGAIFGALLVATLMQNYYRNNINQLVTTRASQTQHAEQSPVSSADTETPATKTNTPIADSTATTGEQKATEQTTQEQVATQQSATTPTATDDATTSDQKAPQTQQTASDEKSTAPAQFTYTAQAGESYSLLARKAIKSYTDNQKITLTPAQAVAAEAFLTTQVGSPELNEGQGVIIASDSVKTTVENAQMLDSAALALWDAYAQNVDLAAATSS